MQGNGTNAPAGEEGLARGPKICPGGPLWTPPLPPGRRTLQWTVRILLECVLVIYGLASLHGDH